MNLTTFFGVLVSIAVVYVLCKGFLCCVFDVSNWAVKKLEAPEKPKASEPLSISSSVKTVLFWVSIIFLGFMAWRLIQHFVLEGAFFKAVAVAAGLCFLGIAVCFVCWLRDRATERTSEKDFRG